MVAMLLSGVAVFDAIKSSSEWPYPTFVSATVIAAVAVTLSARFRDSLLPVPSLFGAMCGALLTLELSVPGKASSELGSLI